MKIKLPQLLGGIAALAFTFTNFLYLINWFVAGYSTSQLRILIWPFAAIVQIAALLIFTLLFKNTNIRIVAVGVFVLIRLIHSLSWMNLGINDGVSGIINSVKIFFGWLYEPYTVLEKIATLTGVLSFLIFGVATILSFLNLPQTSNPARPSTNTQGDEVA
jgi:hypothetical protein